MPLNLKLVSPWKWNWLESSSRRRFPANAQLTRDEFAAYLCDLAREHELPIEEDCSVHSVQHFAKTFHLHTRRGNWEAQVVVSATGYFSNPLTPPIATEIVRSGIPAFHYEGYRNATGIIDYIGPDGSVLIVGKRLSAGQVALDLADAGLAVAISHRAPIQFGVDDWLWPGVYRTFAYGEWLRLLFGPGKSLDVRMQGGRVRKLIANGTIKCYPPIAGVERGSIVFENGIMRPFDLVIFATGFAPALDCLHTLGVGLDISHRVPSTSNFESASVPNLFFLGLDMLRNFQSRFLRGIRKDAIVLADLIAARVGATTKNTPRQVCAT